MRSRHTLVFTCLVLIWGCQESVAPSSAVQHISEPTVQIDSDMTLDEALQGVEIPDGIKQTLELLTVRYIGFDGSMHQGQLVCHREATKSLSAIFDSLLRVEFPIESVRPISHYHWDDEQSMADNNTSCFNYRSVFSGNQLSEHGYGRAIDINPRINPYIGKDGVAQPANSSYTPGEKGTITSDDYVVRLFRSFGWKWGGNWRSVKDYQHFSMGGR